MSLTQIVINNLQQHLPDLRVSPPWTVRKDLCTFYSLGDDVDLDMMIAHGYHDPWIPLLWLSRDRALIAQNSNWRTLISHVDDVPHPPPHEDFIDIQPHLPFCAGPMPVDEDVPP